MCKHRLLIRLSLIMKDLRKHERFGNELIQIFLFCSSSSLVFMLKRNKTKKTRFCCLWVNTHLFSIRASVNTSALVFPDTRIANCLTASTTESKNLKINGFTQ